MTHDRATSGSSGAESDRHGQWKGRAEQDSSGGRRA